MTIATDILLIFALIAVCAAGCVATLFQFPGTWLAAAATVGYAWYYDWQRIGVRGAAIIVAIAAVAEIAEFMSGMWMAKRGGASRRAAWFGLFGGMFGAILLSVPVPVIGTVIGAVIGCFGGAFVGEISSARTFGEGARSGYYSALGRAMGSVLKLAAAVVIAALASASAIIAAL